MLVLIHVSHCIVHPSQWRDLPEVCTAGRGVDVTGREIAVSNGKDLAGSAGGAAFVTGTKLASAIGVDGDGPFQLLVQETTTSSIVAKTISAACLASTRRFDLAEEVVKA